MSNYNKQNEYAKIQMSKISYFCSVTGDNDYLKAERYLTEADWDEQCAVQTYFLVYQNDIPNQPINNNHKFQNKNQNNQPQISPVNKFKPQMPKQENINNNKTNYLEYNISETQMRYGNESYPYSEFLNNISKDLNPVQRVFNVFLKTLQYKGGIIIVFNKDSFNRLMDQIKKINENNFNKEIMQNCVIYPVIDDSPIGTEFIKKLSIVSFPTYIFCKYKNQKCFYITDKMEGAFEISFFIDSILLSISDLQQNSNSNHYGKFNNYENIENKQKNENKEKNQNKENSQNKENKNNLINELLNDFREYRKNILPQSKKQKENSSKQNNNNKNISDSNKIKNNNNIYNKKEDEKFIMPKIQNDPYEKINAGDYYLGDSMEIENIINNNNYNKNNINNININDYDINDYENYKNNNFQVPYINNNINQNNIINNQNNEHNILADSIYQLTDAQIFAKREREMKELERQQAEKEKKEEEEKRKILAEEKRLDDINKNYEDEANIAKMILPDEPEENDPDTCHIVFRVPDGEKNIERKFLKSDKIAMLFNYVKSIGREIFMEPDSTDFDILCYGFPPKNLEDKKNNTLEEEGLYPNSILQIREK